MIKLATVSALALVLSCAPGMAQFGPGWGWFPGWTPPSLFVAPKLAYPATGSIERTIDMSTKSIILGTQGWVQLADDDRHQNTVATTPMTGGNTLTWQYGLPGLRSWATYRCPQFPQQGWIGAESIPDGTVSANGSATSLRISLEHLPSTAVLFGNAATSLPSNNMGVFGQAREETFLAVQTPFETTAAATLELQEHLQVFPTGQWVGTNYWQADGRWHMHWRLIEDQDGDHRETPGEPVLLEGWLDTGIGDVIHPWPQQTSVPQGQFVVVTEWWMETATQHTTTICTNAPSFDPRIGQVDAEAWVDVSIQ